MERVKFYSINDLTYGYNLKKSQEIIQDYDTGKKVVEDINDIVEIYNIKKYFDNNVYFDEWTPDIIERFGVAVKKYFGIAAKNFKTSINDDTIISIYNVVEFYYKNDFWELLEKLTVYLNISHEKFRELLNVTKRSLYEIMRCKDITDHFGELIKEYMLNNPSSAQILLDKYEIKHHREKDPIYIPRELSNSDKETIICNYIDSEDPSLNYLRLITNIQSSKDKLEISPKTILKSKRKVEELEKQFFKDNSGMEIETTVIFSKSQDEEVLLNFEGQSISASYSTKWIERNTDYATLLNNFIFLFEFVDIQMRCILTNKSSEMGVFEELLTSSQNAYNKGFAFEQKDTFSLLQMAGYYSHLFSIGIRLEEVIEWFFENYLANEFDEHYFKVTMPSANSTFLEKCTNIMPALESVLKQFTLYVEEGHIDFELLEIRSEHLIYKNIPSLVDKKYVYGSGNEFNSVTFLLFSDQSGLGYHEKFEEKYNNFFELLTNEKIKLSEIANYNVSKVNWLIDLKYLSVDKDEYVVFNNKQLIFILKDLYLNDVISYWKYSKFSRTIIDDLEKRNVVEIESSLFSRPEQDYINYTLNKSQFNNGLDLRNKYSHTQPNSGEDERIHNQNYLIFLRLFIIAIIKINDDFCTLKVIENMRE
ncbi:hypothetical protein [Paenibacillus oralis]|nr:hypothetical protein [Paenibacillus oralis]